MRHACCAAAILFATTATAPVMAAQAASPLLGKWSIEFEAGRRIEDGISTPVMSTGTLTIVQQADSLVATLEAPPRADGSPVPPSTIGGHVTSAGVVFVQKREAKFNVNGEVTTHMIVSTWTLQASGDSLSGSLSRALPAEMGPQDPSAVKGTRVRS